MIITIIIIDFMTIGSNNARGHCLSLRRMCMNEGCRAGLRSTLHSGGDPHTVSLTLQV